MRRAVGSLLLPLTLLGAAQPNGVPEPPQPAHGLETAALQRPLVTEQWKMRANVRNVLDDTLARMQNGRDPMRHKRGRTLSLLLEYTY
jgi:hypothetical protein